jgi:hypothetical protein
VTDAASVILGPSTDLGWFGFTKVGSTPHLEFALIAAHHMVISAAPELVF